jgi:hypothetical protein
MLKGCFLSLISTYERLRHSQADQAADLAHAHQNTQNSNSATKQTSILKDSLMQRWNSPFTPSKTMLYETTKCHSTALHNTALLAQENTNLRAVNKEKRQKRTRWARQIVHEGGVSIEEGLQLA